MRYRTIHRSFCVLSLLAWGACAGTPATPAQRAAEEARLLAPFRRGAEVGCSELVVELTPNFHGCVSQPAVDKQAHTVRRVDGQGYVETVWTNRLSDPRTAFVVTIGPPVEFGEAGLERGPVTKFLVYGQVRLLVHEERRPLTLTARASGEPMLVRVSPGAAVRDSRAFAIHDGEMVVQ